MVDRVSLETEKPAHVSVLLTSVLKALGPVDSGVYVDATFGAGGVTGAILRCAPRARIYALDRDVSVFQEASARELAKSYENVTFIHSTFDRIHESVSELTDGVIMDFGVSSMQLDRADRGFSFMRNGPLDMRMDRTNTLVTARDIVNGASRQSLEEIFRLYGEEKKARGVARAIEARRMIESIETTQQLVQLIEGVCAPGRRSGGRKRRSVHSATRCFQAIRICVNDELRQIARGLHSAEIKLKPGGVLVAISFHSLEDRIVKRFLTERMFPPPNPSRYAAFGVGVTERKTFLPSFQRMPGFPPIVFPDAEEIQRNPRARCAKMRVAVRTDAPSFSLDFERLGLRLPKVLPLQLSPPRIRDA